MRGIVKIYFGFSSFIKTPGEILNNLKSTGFLVSSLSTCDFSTLFPILPHKLITEKLN